MNETETTETNDAPHDRENPAAAAPVAPPTLPGCLRAALYVSVIGCTLLAIVEFAIARQFFRADILGESWPLRLDFAVAGRIIVSYLLVFTPILLVFGGLYGLFAHKRAKAAPEPFLLALLCLLVAVVIVPADLKLAHFDTLVAAIPAYVMVLYIGAMAYIVARWLRKKWTPPVFSRFVRNSAIACAALATIAAVAFWRSPFANPDAFRARAPSAAAPSRQSTDARPNVLWIVLDTAKADRFSLYGYDKPTSPFLEEFAKQAIVFDRMISNGIWTIPTHASMFTGRPIREHGMGKGAPGIAPEFKTVAEHLTEAGYATAIFTNNPLISDHTTLARGFEERFTVFTFMRSIRFSFDQWFEDLGILPPLPWFDQDFGAALTNDRLAQWLTRLSAKSNPQPTFVFINYMEAHLPFRAPRRYREMFMAPETVRRSFELREAAYGDMEEWLHNDAIINGYDDMPQLDRDALSGQYDAGVRYLDDRIRELIGLFEAAGRLDNTLVIITSDHGEYLDTHEMWSHHFLTYQDVIHLPLIIREPGRTTGLRTPHVAQLTDLFPTVLRAALGPDAPRIAPRNQDLLEVVRWQDASQALDAAAGAPAGRGTPEDTPLAQTQSRTENPPRYAIAEHYGAGKKYDDMLLAKTEPKYRHRAARQLAVVDDRYKYIWSSDGTRELYDLTNDPTEQHNLAQELPAEVRRLQQELDRWKRAVPEFDVKSLLREGEWSDPVMRQLEALGYVGGDDD
jgi:arylsulfatase A-like enzyme